jgi:hypothetical protein
MPASDVRLEAILGFRIGIDSHYINSGECEIVQKAFIETE